MSQLRLIILGLYNVFLVVNFNSLQINNIIMFCLKKMCSLTWQIRKPDLSRYNWSCSINSQIPIPLVLNCRLTLGQGSQTWFLAFLGKCHLHWRLFDYVIKRLASRWVAKVWLMREEEDGYGFSIFFFLYFFLSF